MRKSKKNHSLYFLFQPPPVPDLDYKSAISAIQDSLTQAQKNDLFYKTLQEEIAPLHAEQVKLENTQKLLLGQIKFIDLYCKHLLLPFEELLKKYDVFFEELTQKLTEDQRAYLKSRNPKLSKQITDSEMLSHFRQQFIAFAKCPIESNLEKQAIDKKRATLQQEYDELNNEITKLQDQIIPLGMQKYDRDEIWEQEREKAIKNVKMTFEKKRNPFTTACRRGDLILVQEILKEQKNIKEKKRLVNAHNGNQEYPLHLACKEGHFDIVRWLLDTGAKPNKLDKQAYSPAYYTLIPKSGKKSVPFLELLKTYNVDIKAQIHGGRTLLHTAAFYGDLSAVEWLLKHGLSINAKAANESDGQTPLHKAVAQGHLSVVQFLLSSGADPSIKSRSGEAPLVTALIEQHSTRLNGEIPLHYDSIIQTFLGHRAWLLNDDIAYLKKFLERYPSEILEAGIETIVYEQKRLQKQYQHEGRNVIKPSMG